jgi:ABC-2 type transport system permease protein
MHDATSISLILIIPAVQIVLFGYAVNLTPKDIPIAISGGHNAAADEVRRTVEETGYFVIEADHLPPGGAREMVARGKALVGIQVPPVDGSSSDQGLADPTIIVDASDPEAVRPALTALENNYLRHVAETFAIGPVPEAKVVFLFNPTSETAWAIVPGLVGVVVMITMLVLGALTLVREPERAPPISF